MQSVRLMQPQGLTKQVQNLFDEETSEKAKELADAYKETKGAKGVNSIEALITRSSAGNQLYDVCIVDHLQLQNTYAALEGVDFDTASKYVLLYNSESMDSTAGTYNLDAQEELN